MGKPMRRVNGVAQVELHAVATSTGRRWESRCAVSTGWRKWSFTPWQPPRAGDGKADAPCQRGGASGASRRGNLHGPAMGKPMRRVNGVAQVELHAVATSTGR